MKRALLLSVAIVGVLVFVSPAHAQGVRSYQYKSIDTTVVVNKDTTVDITEDQQFTYQGVYNLGWRSIPHTGYDAITDVSVVDGDTGVPLHYSLLRLNKDLQSSWGAYTVFSQDNATNIEWYYDLSHTADPTSHHWILHYKVHGALGFFKDHDELYWNLFTKYSVPVRMVDLTVTLPGPDTAPQMSFYTSGMHPYTSDQPTTNTFIFHTTDIRPNEAVTFAVGWQKGLVDQNAYWFDALKVYWAIVASILLFVCSVGFAIIFWLYEEHKYRGRGTIVPQYEPPEALPPAMAEIVAKRSLNLNAWPATVVDLAVRGYITIEDRQEKSWFGTYSDYILHRTAKTDDGTLKLYERKFLDTLFLSSDHLSLSDLKGYGHVTEQRRLATSFDALSKELYVELQESMHIFVIGPDRAYEWWKYVHYLFVFIQFVVFGVIVFGSLSPAGFTFTNIFSGGVTAVSFAILIYVLYFRRELNTQGHILKEEWLGFKMYLETAEKYRMQDLTPETFERYLPYAMIFDIETKWAKQFDGIITEPPQWYSGGGVGFGDTPGGFSATNFASGFSTSFTTAFASSGAAGGGGAGGAGAAGGGGGGGGGGAA